tara:strand:+ start:58 stop:186 length:129 start_codon:yes stop_codon:yes gene_type:complete
MGFGSKCGIVEGHLKVYYVIFSRGALNPRKKLEADFLADLLF